MDNKRALSFDTLSSVVISITLFLFPLFFLTATTDFFIIPKQLLVIVAVIILIGIWTVKILVEKKIGATSNPLNLPIAIFAVIILASSILSRNRFDSLLQAVPLIFAILLFFAITNSIRDRRTFSFVLSSFLVGAAASALISIAYYFKLYFLPLPNIQNQFFNTFGSVLQHLIYLVPVLVLSVVYVARALEFPKIKVSSHTRGDLGFFIQAITGFFVLAGVLLISYQLAFLPNKPVVLPFVYGFQTAFASISQDVGRFIFSLLLGSGYGTFLVDFTRFKLPSFNLEPNIWNFSFSFSSSYALELIATTGIVGALSYIWLIVSALRSSAIRNPIYAAVIVVFVLSFILPFSYTSVVLLFVILGIYISYLNVSGDRRVYDIVLSLVATKSGMLSFEATPEGAHPHARTESPILSGVVSLIVVLIVGFLGLYIYKFAVSDAAFAESLRQASANNGQKTYELQTKAIRDFPYRADYHRIFSQVNLSIANSLSQNIQAGSSPSAQTQQNISALLQQSINSARNAVTLSPLTSVNWQNLAQIYRSLINVGQNAENFAIASMNQAIALDPYNTQLYIQLGGIYFQLRQFDQAQNQFQVAINLKRDFANAYYNLGHTLEEKGDLQKALEVYQTVKQLSSNNKENLDKINSEIASLEAKIGKQKETTVVTPETSQTPLSISTPQTSLPPQKPPIKISPPPAGDKKATESAQ